MVNTVFCPALGAEAWCAIPRDFRDVYLPPFQTTTMTLRIWDCSQKLKPSASHLPTLAAVKTALIGSEEEVLLQLALHSRG